MVIKLISSPALLWYYQSILYERIYYAAYRFALQGKNQVVQPKPKEIIMSTIRTQLLVVNAGWSCWEARRQDKKATKEVAVAHGTDTGVGRYHKDLLPGAAEHEAILKLRNAWRVWHYENTLPWGDDAGRVLRSAEFFKYGEGFRAYRAQWDTALEDFFVAYPTLVAQAELRLNTLFDANDYPPVSEIKRRFAIRMTTYPLPNTADFRIIEGITPEDAARMEAEAVAGIQERLNDALKDLWERMFKTVSAMRDRLAVPIGQPGAKFHDTLTGNITDLLELMPRLNLTNDPAITAMANQMRALVALPPETLRISPEARTATQQKAADLIKRMAQYVGP